MATELLQYAAAGLPVIGSPIGVNERILAELGMPAPTTEGEWVDAIVDLLSRSTAARAALGRHGRELMQLRYSYDAWLAQWEEDRRRSEFLAPVPVDVSSSLVRRHRHRELERGRPPARVLSIARTPRSGFRIERVTIGDNVSSDNSAVDLEEIALPLDVIRNEPTSAFATARNQGARASPGDYLLFLNPDAHLFPDTDWPWSHPDSSVAFLGHVCQR